MKTALWTLACLAVGAAACSKPKQAPLYEKVPVSRRDLVVSVSAAGQVEPVFTVEVKSKASGEIIEMAVQTGDDVRAGQLLARVDPRLQRNTLAQAQANLEVANAQLKNAQAQRARAEELYKNKMIAETEHEQANLAYATAKAEVVRATSELENARDQMEDTQVKAAIGGTIIQKNVELGTVISSPTRDVGGGTVLFRMANLDTIQVRTLVDETDIGKVQPGLETTIRVDAFPNRPFEGVVKKIEPQASVQQNVTMFPVLIDIANVEHLLKPGMNAEVEISIGRRENVIAIPNAALRTPRDVASAAQVLGLDPQAVQQQLAEQSKPEGSGAETAGTDGQPDRGGAAAAAEADNRQASLGGGAPGARGEPGGGAPPATSARASEGASPTQGKTMTLWNGRTVTLPEGVSEEQVRAIMQKRTSGQEPTPAERALMRRIFGQMGGGGGGGRRGGARSSDFGASFIVFASRGGKPAPLQIQTGLTDLDYIEVTGGLSEQDTVLVLPSASLLQSQKEFRDRFQRMGGGGLPGVQQQPAQGSRGGGQSR